MLFGSSNAITRKQHLFLNRDGILSCVQEHLIRDDHKLILLASLSDSLEYVADSIER